MEEKTCVLQKLIFKGVRNYRRSDLVEGFCETTYWLGKEAFEDNKGWRDHRTDSATTPGYLEAVSIFVERTYDLHVHPNQVIRWAA